MLANPGVALEQKIADGSCQGAFLARAHRQPLVGESRRQGHPGLGLDQLAPAAGDRSSQLTHRPGSVSRLVPAVEESGADREYVVGSSQIIGGKRAGAEDDLCGSALHLGGEGRDSRGWRRTQRSSETRE